MSGARWWAGIAVALVLGGAMFLLIRGIARQESPAAPIDRPPSDRFRFSGVEFSTLSGDEVAFTLRAEEIVHRKQKIGPLTVNPLKEVALRDVRISVARDRRERNDPVSALMRGGLRSFLQEYDLGFVSRVVVQGLRIEILEGEKRSVSLQAERARLGMGSADSQFQGRFTLETSHGDHFFTRDARWDRKAKRFRIDGAWILVTPDGRREGRGGSVEVTPDGRLSVS